MTDEPKLRRGWTTGACATAAARAAYEALIVGAFPDPVTIELPRGLRPAFTLDSTELGSGWARAGVVKDAGDDPDVTNGVTVVSTVRLTEPGTGVTFKAGSGVGTVTLPGLPLAPGEPAINPAPRRMMTDAVMAAAGLHRGSCDVEIEVAIPGGEAIAERTWNPRLGILGGLSILGTTGVVVPYSCAAWIHSIHRGIDVARAAGLDHVAGCTGATSEAAVQRYLGLPSQAMIDMGDFAGGMLRYLRTHPVPRITIGGGFAKISKLACGHLDLHSARSQVDFDWLSAQIADLGEPTLARASAGANTSMEVLEMAQAAGVDVAGAVASAAHGHACAVVEGALHPITVDIVVVDRAGNVIATT